ncbi:MAG TPA: hypothetical protein VK911_03630 [Vicinamibacterales bacterium]|nr:hypothetical protein [Vicinamibacterales bacterium]
MGWRRRGSRRSFLRTLASVPVLGALPWVQAPGLSRGTGRGAIPACPACPDALPASSAAAARRELGFPDARAQWHGDSSLAAALRDGRGPSLPARPVPAPAPSAPFDWEAAGETLRSRFRDLRRHLVFEYYPWYGRDPWQHWQDSDRQPPHDIASNYMPLLGPYDSGDAAVVERHARWIAESGAGAVNLSWWGRDSDTDRRVPLIMDVMRAHDLRVAFHLEPYTDRRAETYAPDVLYLLREYGERRRWDCLLLLEDAAGRSGPVFKSFRTILLPTVVDCHGVRHVVPDYTADDRWRRATDTVRSALRGDFDHVTLLADSLDFFRTRAGGFDGLAIYDNYVEPATWRRFAEEATAHDLVFSFNVNPGFDGVVLRNVEADSCYRPPRFLPDDPRVEWSSPRSRARAARVSASRIRDSLQASVGLQLDAALANARAGFFLVYVNSFNEWHEGHQFEPMKNWGDLTPRERAVGYHNAAIGSYRLSTLARHLSPLVRP